MPSYFKAKVGRHVTYYGANRRRRPGTITAIGSGNGGIVIRICRSGETYGTGAVGILTETSPTQTNVWKH